jgi:P27 family predicted phage terminase small subunit
MKGRKPKPNSLKLLQGAESRYIKNSPKPPTATRFRCPSWLLEYGKLFWRTYAKELHQFGLFTILDRAAFEMLCVQYATAREAYEVLQKEGIVTIDERKLPRKHPAMTIFLNAVKEFKSWCVEFGMTPSSRSRLDIADLTDEYDAMEDLLNKRFFQ